MISSLGRTENSLVSTRTDERRRMVGNEAQQSGSYEVPGATRLGHSAAAWSRRRRRCPRWPVPSKASRPRKTRPDDPRGPAGGHAQLLARIRLALWIETASLAVRGRPVWRGEEIVAHLAWYSPWCAATRHTACSFSSVGTAMAHEIVFPRREASNAYWWFSSPAASPHPVMDCKFANRKEGVRRARNRSAGGYLHRSHDHLDRL